MLVTALLAGALRLGAGESVSEPLADITFTVLAAGGGKCEELYYMEKPEKLAALEFRQFARSKIMRYQGANPLIFSRKSTGAEGQAVYETAASVTLPALTGKFLLIFQSAAQPAGMPTDGKYNVYAMDDSLEGLPADSLRFFNATGVPLAGQIGDNKIELPAGLSGPMDVRQYSRRQTAVNLVVRHAGNDKTVLQNRWSFSPDNRALVLLLPPKKPGSFRLQSFRITEYVAPHPPEPASEKAVPSDPAGGP